MQVDAFEPGCLSRVPSYIALISKRYGALARAVQRKTLNIPGGLYLRCGEFSCIGALKPSDSRVILRALPSFRTLEARVRATASGVLAAGFGYAAT